MMSGPAYWILNSKKENSNQNVPIKMRCHKHFTEGEKQFKFGYLINF